VAPGQVLGPVNVPFDSSKVTPAGRVPLAAKLVGDPVTEAASVCPVTEGLKGAVS